MEFSKEKTQLLFRLSEGVTLEHAMSFCSNNGLCIDIVISSTNSDVLSPNEWYMIDTSRFYVTDTEVLGVALIYRQDTED